MKKKIYICDRCGTKVNNRKDITQIQYKSNSWSRDLCQGCREDLLSFLKGENIEKVDKPYNNPSRYIRFNIKIPNVFK